MTSTTFGFNLAGAAEFWRVAGRLHTIYAELDRTFELGTGPCSELEHKTDTASPEVLQRVCQWFERIDAQVQVWQLRQLLQSTNLQTEENLRYLIVRHLEKKQKTESDKEKIDFLLVQYLAHCAPHGVTEQHITLEGVARVLEPALGEKPAIFPEWTGQLDEKLQRMNASESLEELQDSGALTEAREMKAASGDHYFQPAFLVAFTRFNFLARRAFFRAMHVDLHAIRNGVNELERRGIVVLDCREAGLSEQESLEHVRHVIHQWKTPFRAPYSGGSSFQQLILLRQALQRALGSPSPGATTAAPPGAQNLNMVEPVLSSHAASVPRTAAEPPAPSAPPAAQGADEDHDYLQRCVADIAEQLAAVPPKHTLGVSTINLGGCKLMIATWEAEAFRAGLDSSFPLRTLQRAVAARTILHVCMERQKKHEETNLELALDIARRQVEEMKVRVEEAKEASNIDAAVNLAATAKRLAALVEEGEKLRV
jgi:hypothetical protein